MNRIKISADELVRKLLEISKTEKVCFLDSCGVGHLGSHLLVAGINPIETLEITNDDPAKSLALLETKLSTPKTAAIFTLSYEFGLKLEKIVRRSRENPMFPEPDITISLFDVLIVHDYATDETKLVGNESRFSVTASLLKAAKPIEKGLNAAKSKASSNFTKAEYISNIETIRELIRDGETYQTNLTQQFQVELPVNLTPQRVFARLRDSHPAPFSAFLKRKNDYVVSISPERFALIEDGQISTSPIKGTRPRGKTSKEDEMLKRELLKSEKDRAENTMIVDLLRNDIGRICEFGSVRVEKLCDLEAHPTLFHLVSTVSGVLRKDAGYSEIIKAIFPCGSITGCPKIRTMEIIDALETANRGLSMGAIGYVDFNKRFDLSVAIRTAVIREQTAVFNVGGGIVIDSDPEMEYKESLLKAKAIFNALNTEFLTNRKTTN